MIQLRTAEVQDSELLWKWANQPSVRAASYSSENIEWEEHVKWFESKLKDPNTKIYIVSQKKDLIGYVRFEIKDAEAVVSLAVDEAFRGLGYGVEMVKAGACKLFSETDANVIHAYIKKENTASFRVFQKAGFRDLGIEKIHDQESYHLIMRD